MTPTATLPRTDVTGRPSGTAGAGPTGLPRISAWSPDPSLPAHHARWGQPRTPADLADLVRSAGLRGRGGAGFPTAVKMAAVAQAAGEQGRRPVVVANAAEGEPLSAKDVMLLAHNPHLVLDGLMAASMAVEADRAVLCVKDGPTRAAAERALAERAGVDPLAVEVVTVPGRYITGEESALVNYLTTGRARPTLTPPRPAERGVDRRPTLVDNVETLANVALIARFGPGWWRSVGTEADPGSLLLTVTGAVGRPGLQEIALGTPLAAVLARAEAGPTSGVLVGGYFGTWLTPAQAGTVELTREGLAAAGASLGCGAVAVLPSGCCPLAEVARVAHWLAGQSAGQCGPCANGLPAIAGALVQLAAGDPDGRAEVLVHRWTAMVEGRGACKLPDGAAHFVLSALDVFAGHLAEHRRGGRCPNPDARPVLATPGPRDARRPGR